MVTAADGGISYDRIEAMLHSDSSSSEESEVSYRKSGSHLDASGANKAEQKDAERLKSGAFVGPKQFTLGFGKKRRSFLNRQQEKQTQKRRWQRREAAELRRKQAQQRRLHQRTRLAEPPYLARIKKWITSGRTSRHPQIMRPF
jgi:hypothetical protein